MSSHNINFHFGAKDDPEKHDAFFGSGYKKVISELKDQGYGVTLTRGTEHIDFDTSTVNEIWVPVKDDTFKTRKIVGEQALLNTFQATRDLTRHLRPNDPDQMPLLNAPSIIEFNDSKLLAHTEVLTGISAPTVRFEASDLDAIDALVGDRVFIKPDNGKGGSGLEIITKGQVHETLSRRSDERLIAQEVITMAAKLPGIKPLNETEALKLAELSERDKEIRIIAFRGKAGTELMGVARFMKAGDEKFDTWVHIEQDSIPEEVRTITIRAFDELARKGNVDEIYGAADLMYGSIPSSPEDHWMIGELNLWRPVLSRKGNAELVRDHDVALAAQLVRLARSGQDARVKKGE